MIDIVVTPEDYILSDLLSKLETASSKVFPKTYKAVKMATSVVMGTWKAYAEGQVIPGTTKKLKNPSGEYAGSIKVRHLSPLHSQVYSDARIAKILEDGSKQYDMKKTHPYGKRSRVVKKTVRKNGKVIRRKGDPYLVIPMRHGVPGTLSYTPMPATLYQKISEELKKGNMDLSVRTKGKKLSPNYKGELIPRSIYKWGGSISSGIDNLDNMVVMQQSTPKSKRSAYFTFRIISVNSPAFKWIQKARPAMKITHYVAENTKQIVSEIIEQGIKQDIGLAST